MYLVDKEHLLIDLQFNRFNVVTLSIAFGCNSFIGGKMDNLFLEIDFLFWTFGIEIKQLRKRQEEK